MASQVAVFPTVAMMFIFAGILGGIPELGAVSNESAIKFGQVGVFPLLAGEINSKVIGGLIGIGILMLTPQAAELVKNAIGVKGPQLGAGAMAGAAAGGAVVGAGLSRGGKFAGDYANTKNPIAKMGAVAQARRQEDVQHTAREQFYDAATVATHFGKRK